ncbi:MAG: hypothetical protein HYS13_21585 [Planctomycetia bacterium]|nr:hypothetical protein [Planctomycetia bacterium]
MRRHLRLALGLPITAAMLVTGVIPPAVRHAHADGEKPHDHSTSPVVHSHGHHRHVHHHHDHSARHHHRYHDDAMTATTVSVRGVTEHWHLRLFGWDLTLPVQDRENSQRHPLDDGNRLAALVRLPQGDAVLASPTLVASMLHLDAMAPGEFLNADACNGLRGSAHRPRLLASLPLCDAARHERSGVQLI